MKKAKRLSRASQVTAYTYENHKHFSSHEVNIRLTEQIQTIVKTEETIVNLMASLRQARQRLEAENAVKTALVAILDLR